MLKRHAVYVFVVLPEVLKNPILYFGYKQKPDMARHLANVFSILKQKPYLPRNKQGIQKKNLKRKKKVIFNKTISSTRARNKAR